NAPKLLGWLMLFAATVAMPVVSLRAQGDIPSPKPIKHVQVRANISSNSLNLGAAKLRISATNNGNILFENPAPVLKLKASSASVRATESRVNVDGTVSFSRLSAIKAGDSLSCTIDTTDLGCAIIRGNPESPPIGSVSAKVRRLLIER